MRPVCHWRAYGAQVLLDDSNEGKPEACHCLHSRYTIMPRGARIQWVTSLVMVVKRHL